MNKLPPDIEQILTDLGLSPGEWGTIPEHTTGLGALDRQKMTLLKLKAVLEQVVNADQQRVAALREQLVRLRHGGGA